MEQFAKASWPSSTLSVGEDVVGKPSGTSPACAQMLRVLTSALSLTRPWRPLRARGCASDGTARDPEIQVRALEGPDKGEGAVAGSTQAARGRAEERPPGAAPRPGRGPAGPLHVERVTRSGKGGRSVPFRIWSQISYIPF